MKYIVRVILRGGGTVDICCSDATYLEKVVSYLRTPLAPEACGAPLVFGEYPLVTMISRGEIVAFMVMEDARETSKKFWDAAAIVMTAEADGYREQQSWKAEE